MHTEPSFLRISGQSGALDDCLLEGIVHPPMYATAPHQEQSSLPCAGAGHAKLLEQRALAPLLTSATNISSGQGAPWRGGLPLQALAALATPASHLRLHILSSIQNLLPAMLAASISNEHNEQMLAAMLHVISHSLAPFAEEESTAAGSIGLDLVTGVAQLTLVMPCPRCSFWGPNTVHTPSGAALLCTCGTCGIAGQLGMACV